MKRILALVPLLSVPLVGWAAIPLNPVLCEAPEPPALTAPAIVGDGTPASCTEAAFTTALAAGGAIAFDCGPAPHTITLTSEGRVNTQRDTLIDGGGRITLSGGGTSRILSMDTGNFELTEPTLTVMNLTFRDGRSFGTPIALGTYYDGGGAAIYYVGGNVRVFNATFENNACDDLGPDLAGGAIFGNGRGRTTVVNSDFRDNRCANGGAIGNLWTSTLVYNSLLENNQARGRGANYEGGEHGFGDGDQQGSGGNGGAIQMDGAENDLLLCGVTLRGNRGNALGGAIFRTTYFGTGTMVIDRSLIDANVVTDQPDFSAAGGLFFMGGPITIRDSAFTDNEANLFGAIQLEDAHTVIDLRRVVITGNLARTGLAAVWIGDGVSGAIRDSDVSRNLATGDGGFAAAFAGGGIPGVTLSGTTILDNVPGNIWNPISCWESFQEGGGNYQWPVERAGEGSDDPDALCSPAITVGTPPPTPEAAIAFSGVVDRYTAGERLEARVVGDPSVVGRPLDLWAAARRPGGGLLYFTGDAAAPVTTLPTPLLRDVRSGAEQRLPSLTLPPGIAGDYTLYAIYSVAGRGLDNLAATRCSNLASRALRIDE